MERFVHNQNLLHFRAALAKTADEAERKRIQALLDEEESLDAMPQKPKEK